MCFGLQNAAQTFQRYLDSVIRDFDFFYAYLGDILVDSPDEDAHKRDLESLFQCQSKNCIAINLGQHSPRQQRYAEFISQFTTTIRHAAGDANVAADALSRISEISVPGLDFRKIAIAQIADEELQTLLKPNTGLALQLRHFDNKCVHSTVTFLLIELDDMYHRILGNKNLMQSTPYRILVKRPHCICSDTSTLKPHLGSFQRGDTRFTHVHIDVVGPMPPSRNNMYLLTCIDRFTRWVEAVPMVGQEVTTRTQAFLQE
ncbi:hypothetical protein AVEN_203372-1 [Araneus ventricosus]|uniref:Integrase catalytic domain-containing protein n=1 Tax=Araneus ventricosus TaxID=182803 RepID=A0A4Y2WBF4_ARAVE|nr:hypothetical protein AVEN_203372-1 [Araneus ventricosus]